MYEDSEAQWNGVASRVYQHYDSTMEALDFTPYFTVGDVDELPILKESLLATGHIV
ncbi:hypothetical protein BI084_gp47 [Gordonia phage Terapin]|uniref:Uncharacterized protein n=5 Tax=Terapinvirus terapin TaxID=2734283 RepID=A0A345MB86_9CAUD|nr:hypothetical protein BI084_gp47 [Gordonia phage Terapin]AVP43323.1 hypothetical protein PBI_DJOKOVIC_46 [Gordonia phage Djokovic]AXH67757.1 hypothetical protein SEA_BEYONCAGE_46 [Gordonia phage Beyoncage]QOC56191.1 hypothetical protein SEA_SIENNA_46 [Gordonia phage Sienna]QOC56616.1 hypothetical protein SEA_BITESIZE_46 [Gordonia phage BiteSize]QYW00849.1 hypothetical protein SEA_MADI_46 [Gordonia phage Madi]